MSVAEIQSEIGRLGREELKELEQTIQQALRREPIVETEEMIERRRQLVDEFLAGDESVELASFEADQNVPPATVAATPEMLARRREISRKFQSGEWSVDLPSYEEIKAEARQKDPWNL